MKNFKNHHHGRTAPRLKGKELTKLANSRAGKHPKSCFFGEKEPHRLWVARVAGRLEKTSAWHI